MRFIDDDEVDIGGIQFREQVIRVLPVPEGVEIRDDDIRGKQIMTRHTANRSFIAIKGQHLRWLTTWYKRPSRETVKHIADRLVIERLIKGSANDAPRGNHHRSASGKGQASDDAERRLSSDDRHDAGGIGTTSAKVITKGGERLGLAFAQRLPMQFV